MVEHMEVTEKGNTSDEDLALLFQSVGLKRTNQRIAVYREMLEHASHPAVDEIYKRVRSKLPAISLNTVYKALTALADKGLIRQLDGLSEKAFYDHKIEHHYHFICTRCGAIQDVYINNVDMLRVEGMPDGVEEISIHLKGMCDNCRGVYG